MWACVEACAGTGEVALAGASVAVAVVVAALEYLNHVGADAHAIGDLLTLCLGNKCH